MVSCFLSSVVLPCSCHYFTRVLLASPQILQEMSALFHVHLSLLRCHWITQAECKTIRNAKVIMLTADTMWEFFMIGPYSCLHILFIPVCLASQPGLVFLQVDQMAGNSPSYFHLGSLNIFKMSDNTRWIESSFISLPLPLSHQLKLEDLIIFSSVPQSAKWGLWHFLLSFAGMALEKWKHVVTLYWMAFAECGFSEFDLVNLKTVLITIYTAALWSWWWRWCWLCW